MLVVAHGSIRSIASTIRPPYRARRLRVRSEVASISAAGRVGRALEDVPAWHSLTREVWQLAKAGVEAGELLREFPVAAEQLADLKLGAVIGVDATFTVGQLVDVTGTTKGRGFSGRIRYRA